MSRRRRGRRTVHAPPGTVEVAPDAARPKVRLIAYGPLEIVDEEDPSLAAVAASRGRLPVTWVDVDGLGDREVILGVGELFGLHRLALEDVVNCHQHPKSEEYVDFLYVVARMPLLEEGRLATEQVNLFLGRDFVVTFQEGLPGDTMGPVRQRLQNLQSRLRKGRADYLAYSILDALVDSYFPILEDYGERLEDLEEKVLGQPDRRTIVHLQLIKRDLLTLRRIFWPLREAVGSLLKDPSDLIHEETRLFLRDVQDHAVQLLDLLETFREISGGLVELYLSSVSFRMNEVMKALTIIATIFIPLSFLAGLYGMNFDPDVSPFNMPELRWYLGYPFALLLMATVAALQIGWIWRKGWLASPAPSQPSAGHGRRHPHSGGGVTPAQGGPRASGA